MVDAVYWCCLCVVAVKLINIVAEILETKLWLFMVIVWIGVG